MKKIITAILLAATALWLIPAAASASVTPGETAADPGDSVTLTGTAQAHANVVIKITDEDGNIVFFDAAAADAGGCYSFLFVVPGDMTASTLTVTAGSGNNVDTAVISVRHAPAPTSAPTATGAPATATPAATAAPTAAATAARTPARTAAPTPARTATPKPAGTATPVPSVTASPAASPTPTALAGPTDPVPTLSPAASPATVVITPVSFREEGEGIVTVRIAVADLPEGAFAIRTQDGHVAYVADAVDGILEFQVDSAAMDSGGEIEITVMDGDETPLATACIQVQEGLKTGGGSFPWWIVIAVALLAAICVTWTVFRSKRRGSR